MESVAPPEDVLATGLDLQREHAGTETDMSAVIAALKDADAVDVPGVGHTWERFSYYRMMSNIKGCLQASRERARFDLFVALHKFEAAARRNPRTFFSTPGQLELARIATMADACGDRDVATSVMMTMLNRDDILTMSKAEQLMCREKSIV
eukprot:jgi/Tetstr1/464008/TSEL_008813.t1